MSVSYTHLVGTYSKTHLVGEEQLYLRRGREYPVFRTKYGVIGLLVCYDLCFPETSRILALDVYKRQSFLCPGYEKNGSCKLPLRNHPALCTRYNLFLRLLIDFL